MNFSTPPLETKKGMNDKIENPQKTYFFRREDGSVFPLNEAAAWNVYSGKAQTVGVHMTRPKLVGTSDGKIMYEATIKAKEIFNTEGLEKAQEHLRQAQERELEESLKHPEAPRNFDTVGTNGQPVNINSLRI